MNLESSIIWLDNIVYDYCQIHLNDLQRIIIIQVLQNKKYLEIAEKFDYTEGHIKDSASELWKLLSAIFQEKINKGNFSSFLIRQLSKIDLDQEIYPSSPNFLGRDKVITEINKLAEKGSKIIFIQGEGGIGKTTLAQQYLKQQNFEIILELLMAKETSSIISIDAIIEEWLKYDLNLEPGKELGISLSRLKRYLTNHKIGILIDNLEPALNRDGNFIPPHQNYVELLRILGNSQLKSLTLITSRDRLCEPDLNLTHFRLSGLDLKAWEDYFINYSIQLDLDILTQLNYIYGGNAKAMKIIASAIHEEFAGNIQAYWQENKEYPLIKLGLKNEAVSRLKTIQMWQLVNQKIALFFTTSVTRILSIEDAIIALEAYHHYVEIGNFQEAAQVLLKSRDNQWGQFLPLGSTLYRLGLIQPVLNAIENIIDKIDSVKYLAELYNIWGDLFWIIGKIENAINCQEKAIIMSANESRKVTKNTDTDRHYLYYLKMVEVDSILSIGLYQIDLWELESAAVSFQKVIDLTHNTEHYKWGEKATIGLALVKSYLGLPIEAAVNIDIFYQDILNNKYTGRFAYFMQMIGQTYVNLENYYRALQVLEITLTFAEESDYQQIKGKTFLSLGEIYRQQNKIKQAISYQLEALKIFTEIDAKCDLAEAYFQLSLSYFKLGDKAQSYNNQEHSLQLFEKMKAKKQLNKIQSLNQ